MKLSTTTVLATLATAVYAAPPDLENRGIEKRATCVFNGYTYPCIRPTTIGGGSPAPTTPAGNPAPAPTSGGGSGGGSTGGRSSYTRGSTANDVANNNGCTPLTVIFARGTSEPGNIGSIAGPPMFQQLISSLGATGVTLQGVDYPASSAGNFNCGQQGSSEMASLASAARQRCPNTRIVLSGYSQGACVVHRAASSSGDIAAAVLFGDPLNGQAVGSVPRGNIKQICGSTDSICSRGGSTTSGGHLSYGSNAQEAARFIVDTAL
ncbi:hypothetical protein MBLNU230_g8472t1 [Neophaeotheca triangularis]